MYISTLLYHTLKGDDKMLVSLLSFDKKSYLFDTKHLIFISAIALKYDDGNKSRVTNYTNNVIFLLNLIWELGLFITT